MSSFAVSLHTNSLVLARYVSSSSCEIPSCREAVPLLSCASVKSIDMAAGWPLLPARLASYVCVWGGALAVA